MKWLGVSACVFCAIVSGWVKADVTLGADSARLSARTVPVLRHPSDGRTVLCTIVVNNPVVGETLLVSTMVGLSNYQPKVVGNTLTVEYCASGLCYKNGLAALGGTMWLDGGNITADMNHGVYHPSARLKVERKAARITFGLVGYTYSTQPGGANKVDRCHMIVDRVTP